MTRVIRKCSILIFLQFNLYLLVESIEDQKLLSLLCQSNSESCTHCLNIHSNCSWCFDLEFNHVRCDLKEKLNNNNCELIEEGKKSTMHTIYNQDFRDVTDMVKNAIQIRPQKVKLQLRPGDTKTIKLKYQIAKNYPLDLYYLMDATYTMKDDLETVATLGDHLTHSLSNLTKHFRIGFGTFSDKVAMPFIRMDEKTFQNPCLGSVEGFCSPSYGFKHHFSLNKDVQGFIEKVNKTAVTANLDNAEGALDALMQVLVCGQKVGWRNDSRKMVLLLTNGLLHFAGDGKLAGIPKKTDGLCHLDLDGFYAESVYQDYPSLGQIIRKLRKHKTNVIFAVTEDVYEYYKKLNNLIPNFSYVTQLHSDSSNILNVIKKGYEDVVSTVQFQDNAKHPIEITYFSNCNRKYDKLNQTNSCYGVKEGEKYEFFLNVKIDECPSDPNLLKQTILVDESHLETESLVIDVELLCGCNCDGNHKNSSMCNYNGDIECGTCKCNPGWSGKACDCNLANFENNRELENKCRQKTNNTTSIMCHGKGDCICGECFCESMYTGQYCECKNCQKINEVECGGPSRGLCSCGTCLCMPGYTGPNCLCSLDKETCIAPGDKEECSGHGYCNCGKCECNSEPFKFSGNYCEKCSTCAGLCHLYEKCAKCTIQNTCKGDECNFNIISSIEFVDVIDEENNNKCIVQVDKQYCQFWEYTYDLNKNNTVHILILNRSCSAPISATFYAAGAFLLVVLLGVLGIVVFIWQQRKRDAEEYAKFIENVNATELDNINPDFIPATKTYEMPADAKFS